MDKEISTRFLEFLGSDFTDPNIRYQLGIVGLGIGDQELILYLKNKRSKPKNLPLEFEGYKIKTEVVGEIRLL